LFNLLNQTSMASFQKSSIIFMNKSFNLRF